MAIPIDRDVPDLTGWLAYCPTCGQDRGVRRVRENGREAHIAVHDDVSFEDVYLARLETAKNFVETL